MASELSQIIEMMKIIERNKKLITELGADNERLKTRLVDYDKRHAKFAEYLRRSKQFASRFPDKCHTGVQTDAEVIVHPPPAMEPRPQQVVIEEVQPPRKKKTPKLLAKVKQEVMETDEVAKTATLNVPGTSHKNSRLEAPPANIRIKPEPMETEEEPTPIARNLPPARDPSRLAPPPSALATRKL